MTPDRAAVRIQQLRAACEDLMDLLDGKDEVIRDLRARLALLEVQLLTIGPTLHQLQQAMEAGDLQWVNRRSEYSYLNDIANLPSEQEKPQADPR